MKTNILITMLLLLPMVAFGQQTDTTDKTDTVQIYIPQDLPDCIIQLDSMLSKEDKAYIISAGASSVHFTLGLWMRNNWGLWGGSRLKSYFHNNGIRHPDDMSGVILDCYEKHLKGEGVNYRQMLRKVSRDEKKWFKKAHKWEKKRQKEWLMRDHYDCDHDDTIATFESATAFLGLPLTVDSSVGTQIRKHENWEPAEEEMQLVRKTLLRKPYFTPRPDELVRHKLIQDYGRQPNGGVERLIIDDANGRHHKEYLFNRDGTLATRIEQRQEDSNKSRAKTQRDEYTYLDGQLSTKRHYTEDTLKAETRYIYLPDNRLKTYTSSLVTIDTAENDSVALVTDSSSHLLSPEGQILVSYRQNGQVFRINEYDTLGRNVTVLYYISGELLSNWWSEIYDDTQNLCYEIHRNVFEHVVECSVFNKYGDLIGKCCADKLNIFDRKKTPWTYRYDRQGNWTHKYEVGKLTARCKITYYK